MTGSVQLLTSGSRFAGWLSIASAYGATDAWDFTIDRYMRASAPDASGLTVTRASTGYAETTGGVLVPFASGELRRTDRGVLIEGARTNLLLRSQELNDAVWQKSDVTVTANAATAPDGTTTADSVIENTANAIHRTNQPVTVTLSQVATVSAIVRPVGSRRLYLNAIVVMGAGALFDFAGAGSVIATAGTAGNLSASIRPLASGFYLVTLTGTGTGTANNVWFQLATSAHSTATDQTYTGDGTSGMLVWATQLEEAAFASSYIPTVASTVTRAADLVTATLSGYATAVTLFGELACTQFAGTGPRFFQWGDVKAFRQTATETRFAADASGVFAIKTGIAAGPQKVAGIYTVGAGSKMTVNGASVATGADTGVAIPAGAFYFGNVSGADRPSNDYLRRVAIFPLALTDAQLTAITT
jgi:hypothetical protein